MKNFIIGLASLLFMGTFLYVLYQFLPWVALGIGAGFIMYGILKPEFDKNNFYARANQQMMEDDK